MARLAFCADEHVPQAFVTTLRSNGYPVVEATEERGERTIDERLLKWCAERECVLLTNDRDFVRLAEEVDHAGVVVYTTQELTPGEFARGIRRIDRQFSPDDAENALLWLEAWL